MTITSLTRGLGLLFITALCVLAVGPRPASAASLPEYVLLPPSQIVQDGRVVAVVEHARLSSATVVFTQDPLRAVTVADSPSWNVVDPATGRTWTASVEGALEAEGALLLMSRAPRTSGYTVIKNKSS